MDFIISKKHHKIKYKIEPATRITPTQEIATKNNRILNILSLGMVDFNLASRDSSRPGRHSLFKLFSITLAPVIYLINEINSRRNTIRTETNTLPSRYISRYGCSFIHMTIGSV
jgi:hypothetical protein